MVLAFIMHSYIWGDDIAAEVSFHHGIMATIVLIISNSEFLPRSLFPSSRSVPTSSSHLSPHTLASASGISALYSPTNP